MTDGGVAYVGQTVTAAYQDAGFGGSVPAWVRTGVGGATQERGGAGNTGLYRKNLRWVRINRWATPLGHTPNPATTAEEATATRRLVQSEKVGLKSLS